MIADFALSKSPRRFFAESVDPQLIAIGDPLILALVETHAFQRLKSVHFMGAIDYLLVRAPNGQQRNMRHTRYQHSLGVAQLASHYAKVRNLPEQERRLVITAALLHDLGHAPLSHSLEPVFKEEFGIEHHQATEKIIMGDVPIGTDVYRILIEFGIDIERLIALIRGSEDRYDGFFSGPINFDTIEGILRSHTYFRTYPHIPSPTSVVDAAMRRNDESDLNIVDSFWELKDEIYRHIINSNVGVMADYITQCFFRKNLHIFSASDYFITEKQLFKKLPGLHKILTSCPVQSQLKITLNTSIVYKKRRFFIDKNIDFFSHNDKRRYIQTKNECIMVVRRSEFSEPFCLSRDLFDD